MSSHALSLINAPKTIADIDKAPYQESSSKEIHVEKRKPLALLRVNHKAPTNSTASIPATARSSTSNIGLKRKAHSGHRQGNHAGHKMGGKAKKTESSSTLPMIRRHLPQPSIKRRVGQYESSDEEDDPNNIAELLAKQASLRAELWVLKYDLEEKNTEIRNLSDNVNRFHFKFNTKLRKVVEALGVGRLVEDFRPHLLHESLFRHIFPFHNIYVSNFFPFQCNLPIQSYQ